MISVFDRVENIEGYAENDGYLDFILFLQCFNNYFTLGLLRLAQVAQSVAYRNWEV